MAGFDEQLNPLTTHNGGFGVNPPPTAAAREPVTLVKGGHRWSFSCDPGDEPELLRRVTELARGEDVPFDWFDAALVTHQLSKRLKAGLYRIDGNSTGTVA